VRFKFPTFIHRSTREFFAEGRRTPGYSLLDAMHGYIYARWLYTYIALALGNHPIAQIAGPLLLWIARHAPSGEQASYAARAFADTYHGKVVSLSAARQLVSVKEDIRLTDLEKVIPYARARDIVLQHPDHLAVADCACRAARANPCGPIDVCLIVGEPFASFVVDHHPGRARRITQAEAMDLLAAEHARGHVQHAFFKDAMLGRFYAICNCCSCCCGAMQAQRHGVPMLASSGYVAEVDPSECIACGSCQERCQFGAISVNGYAVIDAAACMGCGVCVSQCPQEAMSLVRDERRGVPLELDELMREAMQGAGSSKLEAGRA